MESTKTWQAMINALSGHPPHDARVLRLEDRGPASKAGIIRYVRAVLEAHTTPKNGANTERLAETITVSVLNRLGAAYTPPGRR